MMITNSRFVRSQPPEREVLDFGAVDLENDLKNNYKNPGHPIAFSGVNTVYKFYNGQIPLPRIKQLLASIESYTLHREFHKSQRNPSFTHFKRYQFQMDLVDVQEFSKQNDGNNFLLNVIDTFTRYAFVRPLQDKSANTVLKAFISILKEAVEKPYMIVMDKGTEFQNEKFNNFCNQQNIKLVNPQSQTHAAYIERFNRTLQQLIYKYMTENETNRYVDVLQNLVKSYNNRIHRMIQTTPFIAETNQDVALNIRLLNSKRIAKFKKVKQKFKINDYVRIAKQKTKFSRGYDEQTSREIFRIYKIDLNKHIPLYYLESYDKSEKLKGGFYSFELTLVDTEVFRIEKVLRRRRYRGKNQIFVKWKGFNDNYNSWIDEDNVEQEF